jgi:hypothetical protein
MFKLFTILLSIKNSATVLHLQISSAFLMSQTDSSNRSQVRVRGTTAEEEGAELHRGGRAARGLRLRRRAANVSARFFRNFSILGKIAYLGQ